MAPASVDLWDSVSLFLRDVSNLYDDQPELKGAGMIITALTTFALVLWRSLVFVRRKLLAKRMNNRRAFDPITSPDFSTSRGGRSEEITPVCDEQGNHIANRITVSYNGVVIGESNEPLHVENIRVRKGPAEWSCSHGKQLIENCTDCGRIPPKDCEGCTPPADALPPQAAALPPETQINAWATPLDPLPLDRTTVNVVAPRGENIEIRIGKSPPPVYVTAEEYLDGAHASHDPLDCGEIEIVRRDEDDKPDPDEMGRYRKHRRGAD